jgi:hypothetical protein
VLYPPASQCAAYKTKALCLKDPSKFMASSSLCSWSKATGCSVTPPPASLTFSLMVTLICHMIAIPLDLLIGKVQEIFGAKEPDFENWGVRKVLDRYFGACFVSKSERNYRQRSPLELVEQARLTSANMTPEAAANKIADMELGYVEAYADTLTAREELLTLTSSAQLFFQSQFRRSFAVNDLIGKERMSTLKAINAHLMMNLDGTLVPLTWRQRLWHKDRQDMLEKKIQRAKDEADDVIAHVLSLPPKEAGYKDVALIHHFMLENVHWYYRMSLSLNLFGFNCLPERIDPTVWILAWIFISGSIAFFLYWTFAWGEWKGC